VNYDRSLENEVSHKEERPFAAAHASAEPV
jgi:hypothetical protein